MTQRSQGIDALAVDSATVDLRPWLDPPVVATLRSSRDLRWLQRARRVAETVDGKWRVGCVIVRGGRVLSASANVQRNDPEVLDGLLWHTSEHAEVAALRMAADVRGATAYVARVGRDGADRHAQPCRRCRAALEAAGVDVVWTSDERYVAERAARATTG